MYEYICVFFVMFHACPAGGVFSLVRVTDYCEPPSPLMF